MDESFQVVPTNPRSLTSFPADADLATRMSARRGHPQGLHRDRQVRNVGGDEAKIKKLTNLYGAAQIAAQIPVFSAPLKPARPADPDPGVRAMHKDEGPADGPLTVGGVPVRSSIARDFSKGMVAEVDFTYRDGSRDGRSGIVCARGSGQGQAGSDVSRAGVPYVPTPQAFLARARYQ